MSFRIFTDTPANLPSSLILKHGITVIPFSYFADGKEYTCQNFEEFDCDAYYDELRAGKSVKTSQITPARYIEYMEPAVKEGEDILYVSLSSGVSGSFASAKVAAVHLSEKYPERKITVLDSLGASFREGLIVLHAAKCLESGKTLDETEEELKRYRERICQIFTVDDLMHLRRNGRISGFNATLGTALGIKPLLKGDASGKIVNFSTVRGRKKAIESLVQRYKEHAVSPEGQTVGISHAGCLRDAELLRDMVVDACTPREVIIVAHEPATGAHVGPGMLALYFEGDEKIREKN